MLSPPGLLEHVHSAILISLHAAKQHVLAHVHLVLLQLVEKLDSAPSRRLLVEEASSHGLVALLHLLVALNGVQVVSQSSLLGNEVSDLSINLHHTPGVHPRTSGGLNGLELLVLVVLFGRQNLVSQVPSKHANLLDSQRSVFSEVVVESSLPSNRGHDSRHSGDSHILAENFTGQSSLLSIGLPLSKSLVLELGRSVAVTHSSASKQRTVTSLEGEGVAVGVGRVLGLGQRHDDLEIGLSVAHSRLVSGVQVQVLVEGLSSGDVAIGSGGAHGGAVEPPRVNAQRAQLFGQSEHGGEIRGEKFTCDISCVVKVGRGFDSGVGGYLIKVCWDGSSWEEVSK